MIEAVRRVAPIVATGLVGMGFLGIGVVIGAKRGKTVEIQPVTSYRFQPLKDGEALDTKTGKICTTVSLPVGATLEDGTPSCLSLTSQ